MKKIFFLILFISAGFSVLPSHPHVKSISPEITCLTITTNNQDESSLTNNCDFNITILNKNTNSSRSLESGETFSLESDLCYPRGFDIDFTDCYLAYGDKTSDMVLFLYNRSREIDMQRKTQALVVLAIFFALFCLSGFKIAYKILKKKKPSIGLVMLFCIAAIVFWTTILLLSIRA